MAGLFDFIDTGANLAALQSSINQARQTGQLGMSEAERIGARANKQTQFRPFTVSTRTGSVATDPTGGFATSLDPNQASASGQFFNQGRNLLSGIGSIEDRSQSIFDSLANIRNPQNERDRLSLEQRLYNQGRSEVRTDQFGGSPEQLAMAIAQQEQQSKDLFTSRQQATNERLSDFNIGSGFFDKSFDAERELLPFLESGRMLSDIANTGQREGATAQARLGQTGIDALLKGENIAGDLQERQIEGFLDIIAAKAGQTTGGEGSVTVPGFFDKLFEPILNPGQRLPGVVNL
tara:strand:+ start:522 stop:1397 length:876 start_codon:yes stop_codon:yes gene_type:complete